MHTCRGFGVGVSDKSFEVKNDRTKALYVAPNNIFYKLLVQLLNLLIIKFLIVVTVFFLA